MFLKKATGRHFRNYNSFSLAFGSNLNIFVGGNGEGKSSLLEALYCGLKGKSFYPAARFHFIQKDKDFASIHLEIEGPEGLFYLETAFSLQPKPQRQMSYCGKKSSPLFLAKKFPCFAFTEESMKCLRGEPSQRRAFIDEMLSGKEIKNKEDFIKVLNEKRRLLKNIKQELLPFREGQKTLAALNEIFLQKALLLTQARIEALKALFLSVQGIRSAFFSSPVPQLGFSYSFSDEGESNRQSKNLLSLLAEDINKKKEREIQAGIPLSGPQKHDIRFLFNGRDSRVFCSKGQQRAFVLSLVLSHITRYKSAFLFLDDALSELDPFIQEKFLHFIEKSHCQSFLTDCKTISFKADNLSLFSVKKGLVQRYE